MTVFGEGEAGKNAVTHYKVLERFGYVTFLECQLETGRTHQIRAHMKHIDIPYLTTNGMVVIRFLKGRVLQNTSNLLTIVLS